MRLSKNSRRFRTLVKKYPDLHYGAPEEHGDLLFSEKAAVFAHDFFVTVKDSCFLVLPFVREGKQLVCVEYYCVGQMIRGGKIISAHRWRERLSEFGYRSALLDRIEVFLEASLSADP